MLGSLDVHNDLSIIRYEPYHGFYKDNKRLTVKKKYPKVIIKNGLLAIEEEQSTEIKVIMDIGLNGSRGNSVYIKDKQEKTYEYTIHHQRGTTQDPEH